MVVRDLSLPAKIDYYVKVNIMDGREWEADASEQVL
jgi:hypothetical protein